MAVGTLRRSSIYVECFYTNKMTLTDIARQYGVSKVAVREAIIKSDPEAYQQEKARRSEERKKARRKRELEKRKEIRRQNPKRKKRKLEYVLEEKDAWEWLERHFKQVFPFKKHKGMSDSDLVWFACAQSGIKNVLDDPLATRDIKAATRAAYRQVPPQIQIMDEFAQPGCYKSGKGGGRHNTPSSLQES